MREIKAEGGWGVVNTEYCSIHPSSDDLPHSYAALWDKTDVKAHQLMTSKVHAHGALAGAELWYGGANASSQYTRLPPLDVNSRPNSTGLPFQSRKMDNQDFKDLRNWFKSKWVNIGKKDKSGKHPACGTSGGGYTVNTV